MFPEAGETYDVVYTCHKVTYVVFYIDTPLHFLVSFPGLPPASFLDLMPQEMK